jgi:hypothetical protein
MYTFRFIFTIALVTTILFGCKKEEITTEPPIIEANIAPCTLTEMSFPIDSIYSGNSTNIPDAGYSVKFVDTTPGAAIPFIEFGFKTTPTTGNYYLVSDLDMSPQGLENQITYIRESNNFIYKPAGTNDSTIYVEKNQNELIISYCDLPDTMTFWYNSGCNCYVGNHSAFAKYQVNY